MSHLTSHDKYPPFASNVTTAPLVTISLSKLEKNDPAESAAFFEASKSLGFFYLDMNGSELGERMVIEAEKLHALQVEWFKTPKEEKDEFRQEKIGPFYAYRPIDQKEMDDDGLPKRNESYNVCSFIGTESLDNVLIT
jgi:hypothetical protein